MNPASYNAHFNIIPRQRQANCYLTSNSPAKFLYVFLMSATQACLTSADTITVPQTPTAAQLINKFRLFYVLCTITSG